MKNTIKPWIFNKTIDIFFSLFGIVLFYLVYSSYSYEKSLASLFSVILFWSVVILESGHVYLIYFRLFKEWKYIKKIIIITHLIFFSFFFLMQSFLINHLWHIVVYCTLFHNIRQFYGIFRWYLFLNKDKVQHSKYLSYLFHFLTITPIVALHFRPGLQPFGYYGDIDIFYFPDLNIFSFLLLLNFLCITAWIIYEYIFHMKNNIIEKGRLLYLTTTIIFFNLLAFLGQNQSSIIIPLVATHGLQYYILSYKFMNERQYYSTKHFLLYFVLTGIALGVLNNISERALDMDYSYLTNFNIINALGISLILTPLFAHHFFDMIIWKKSYIRKHLKPAT